MILRWSFLGRKCGNLTKCNLLRITCSRDYWLFKRYGPSAAILSVFGLGALYLQKRREVYECLGDVSEASDAAAL